MKLLMENWRKYLEEGEGGFTVPYQLFIPRGCPDEKCDIAKLGNTPPVENRGVINKPNGGLWTSTAVNKGDKWTSAWNDWMVHEMPEWMHPQGILLKSKTNNIFHIENDEDARILHEEFPLEFSGPNLSLSFGGGSSDYNIDFESALQKYDAIHFGTTGGEDSDAYGFGRSGMWDMESTVFRDASVIDVIKVVPVTQKQRGDDF